MVDMVASGMAASENAARVYGNGEERFSSKAPAGKNSVGKSDGAGNTVEKAGTSFHKYILLCHNHQGLSCHYFRLLRNSFLHKRRLRKYR